MRNENPKVPRLQEKSWKEVQDYLERDQRVIIPVGSTEQHGCFAPPGTDATLG